jgi:trans-aconitate methyltransferase
MERNGMTGNDFDPERYDAEQGFVSEHGTDLVDLLAPEDGERVLDLGCGTGHLTSDLAERGADVVGVDQSPEMVARAAETYPDLRFERADARSLDFEGTFDAVFSNAALHWIPASDQDAALESVANALVPGGRFVAEMGGTGNVAAIVDATVAELDRRDYDVDSPWYFPSVGEYATRLEGVGFEVRYARLFDRPTTLDGDDGLRNWLEQFGDSLFAPLTDEETGAVVSAVEDELRPAMFDGEDWTADYRRLRFSAVLSA